MTQSSRVHMADTPEKELTLTAELLSAGHSGNTPHTVMFSPPVILGS